MNVRKFWWGLFTLTLASVSATAVWNLISRYPSYWTGRPAYRSGRRAEPDLPIFGTISDFTLIDQSQNSFTRQALGGQIWVVDFIYTRCGDQCPRLSQKMAKIQSLMPIEAHVQFLSISVDPGHDTPPVLSQYARRYHADPNHWRFLTGSPAAIHVLAENFKFAPSAQGSNAFIMNHSTRLIVVDVHSRIRGYYDGTDDADIQRLVRDVSRLANKDLAQ